MTKVNAITRMMIVGTIAMLVFTGAGGLVFYLVERGLGKQTATLVLVGGLALGSFAAIVLLINYSNSSSNFMLSNSITEMFIAFADATRSSNAVDAQNGRSLNKMMDAYQSGVKHGGGHGKGGGVGSRKFYIRGQGFEEQLPDNRGGHANPMHVLEISDPNRGKGAAGINWDNWMNEDGSGSDDQYDDQDGQYVSGGEHGHPQRKWTYDENQANGAMHYLSD